MCGLFGIQYSDPQKNSSENIKRDIELFSKLSRTRGTDTFGVSISQGDTENIFKINEDSRIALKRKDYNLFLNKNLQLLASPLSINGQTRLVTNGTKFVNLNNQPIITKNIIGTHNGIIIHNESELKNNQEVLEGYKTKSDSLILFEKLSEIYENDNIGYIKDYNNYFRNIIGSFSVAFRLMSKKINFLSSNCGSLYYYSDGENLAYSSEKNILKIFLSNSKSILLDKNKDNKIKQVLNKLIIYSDNLKTFLEIDENSETETIVNKKLNISTSKFKIFDNISDDNNRRENLKKCTKCILPSTYPFIEFDEDGVSNFYKNYNKQVYLGEDKFLEVIDQYRSKNGEPDCIVGLSGGRDSSYGIHLLKTKFKMNPIAFTYDWGLTTDLSRVNQAKICGKLGIEHIIRSANIKKKREYIRKNIMAWLAKPHLGMLPVIQAGDKPFMSLPNKLSKETGVKLKIQFTGYQLEQREFFLGFTGVNQNLRNNQRMSSYSFMSKFKLFYFYASQSLINPSYLNEALLDNFDGFIKSFVMKENNLHFYNYIKWDENKIINVLEKEYNWSNDLSYGKNQWRMGDGQTAFNNFIYYSVAGFSEFDNFRSNQVCEDLLSRDEALILAKKDNEFKYDTLRNFSEIIGFNLDDVLSKILSIPKLY
jgi:glucosamine--fructose-6-phosphate aminotransferase (isomerizing)